MNNHTTIKVGRRSHQPGTKRNGKCGAGAIDSGDVVGYAGSPNIDSHAVLWRNGMAIDLGVWPGGHYSVANGINNLGQIVGTGTVAGDIWIMH